jgi:hypothetical protein
MASACDPKLVGRAEGAAEPLPGTQTDRAARERMARVSRPA